MAASDIDVRKLRYFLAVVDHGGFARAAKQIHITQPSLSLAIATLERDLGVQLFHRTGRRAVLTDAGQLLVAPARQVLRDLDATWMTATSVRELQRGRLDIVSMPSTGIVPLAALAQRFSSKYPGVLLDIDGVFTAEAVIEAVIDGRAEIGLLGTATPPHLRGLPEVPLQAQPFIVVSPPDIPLGDNGSSVHWNDFQGQRMVVSRGESMMRDLVEQIRNSVVDVDIAVQVAHRTSILPMVLAGLGHAVLPDAWAPLATGMGATVRELLPRTSLQISIVHRDAGLTAAAAAFVKVLTVSRDDEHEVVNRH